MTSMSKSMPSRHSIIRIPNIADHFHTNEPPDDVDVQIFSNTLRSTQDRESFLLEDIRYLKTALDHHLEELSRVQQTIREYKLVLSPVRRLPGELLMEIFFQVLGSEDPEDVLDFDRGLWPLTHVCGNWRTLILNRTSFWTTVSLPGRMHYPPYAVHILSLFLERSGSRPIFVEFTCRDVASLPQTLFTVLVAQSSRWEICRLRIPVFLTTHLTSRSIERAHLLRHLDLNLDLAYSSTLTTTCNKIFTGAPALRSVKLTGIPLTASSLGLRWSYLTHYNVAQDFPEKHLPILRLATGLVECTINCSLPWRQEPLGSDIVPLRKLQRLQMEGTASVLLQHLAAPSLLSLNIVLPETGDSLKTFLSRSQSRLQELEIEAIPMGNNILDALVSTSYLRRLALNVSVHPGHRQSVVFKDLLVALKYVHNGDGITSESTSRCNILPHLEELALSVYTISSREYLYADELVAMVASRSKVSGKMKEQASIQEQINELVRLKSFTLETNSYWLPPFDGFVELNQEGLQTNLHLH
ncbi:hypothetical protein C8J55DRAFT_519816 [Lentinula edodes]|uniref:F-box domain-containing protein n=1 Tax=Lentinula lateritia TaxID=40482 RepID=A0A9W9DJ06_9AGAR|nr:hypothetical protein C8J55DRAFT_519816 [Lentinula edodes]